MLFSYSSTLAVFFLSLPFRVIGADYKSITCPNGESSVRTYIESQKWIVQPFWEPYLDKSIDFLCRASIRAAPPPSGLGCICTKAGWKGITVKCLRPLHGNWAWSRMADSMCKSQCRCPGDHTELNPSLVDPEHPEIELVTFWDGTPRLGDTSATSESGSGSSWSTTKKASDSGINDKMLSTAEERCTRGLCLRGSDCNLYEGVDGCGSMVCAVEQSTLGFADRYGTCRSLVSLVAVGVLSLGGRSVDQAACACNATYISHQCCETTDGMVWEAPEAKLGELSGGVL